MACLRYRSSCETRSMTSSSLLGLVAGKLSSTTYTIQPAVEHSQSRRHNDSDQQRALDSSVDLAFRAFVPPQLDPNPKAVQRQDSYKRYQNDCPDRAHGSDYSSGGRDCPATSRAGQNRYAAENLLDIVTFTRVQGRHLQACPPFCTSARIAAAASSIFKIAPAFSASSVSGNSDIKKGPGAERSHQAGLGVLHAEESGFRGPREIIELPERIIQTT